MPRSKASWRPSPRCTTIVELFDAGRTGVKLLLGRPPARSRRRGPQARMLQLLAGSVGLERFRIRQPRWCRRCSTCSTRSTSSALDTLFQLADNLENVAKGEKLNTALAARLASRISEITLPRAPLSGAEKNALAFGYWTEKHIDAERKLNLRAAIDKAAEQSREAARRSAARWRRICATRWWRTTTPTTRLPERRS